MKTYAIGDIHGNYPLLKALLQKTHFSYTHDHLIVLGDICDGHPYVYQTIEELLKITHLTLILGNHDLFTLNWMKTGIELPIHYHQGGNYTIASYDFDYKTVPQSHINLLETAPPYLIIPQNTPTDTPDQTNQPEKLPKIFVHGGFDPTLPVEFQSTEVLTWDRELINYASQKPVPNYSTVYVGHTSTQCYTQNPHSDQPLFLNNLIMLDTGAGWNGPLTMIDIKTHKFYQVKGKT